MSSPRPPHARGEPRHSLLALGIAAALCTVSHGAAHAQAGAAPSPAPARAAAGAALRTYSIGAGPLDDALQRFARQAGVLISFDPAVVRGLRTDGFNGEASVAGVLGALIAPHPLAAQSDGPDAWRIRAAPRPVAPPAGGMPSASGGDLPPVVVTADRDARQRAYDTPASVAVITREDMDRLPPRNTSDVLADVPGLYTSQGRDNPGVSVNMRGLQDFGRVNVMIDGTRQNFQQSGHGSNGSVYLDPELLGGVDITKGASSTVGGAGMIAGIVNFRTLEVDDIVREGQTLGARVNATSGTNAYRFAGSTALGIKASPDVDVVMVASRKKMGMFEMGQRGSIADNEGLDKVVHGVNRLTKQDQSSALLKGTWRLAPGQQVKLSYVGFDAKFGENSDSGVEAGGGAMMNHVRSDTLLGNYNWKPAGNPWIDLAASLYYTRTSNKAHRAAGGLLDGNEYNLQYQTSTVGGTLQNSSGMKLGPLDAVFKTGGEFFQDKTDPKAQSLSVGADAGTTALYTGATPAGTRTVASLFGELSLLRGDWLEVTGGMRYDWYGLQGSGRMRVGSIANPAGVRPATTALFTNFETDRHNGAMSPKISIAVKPVEQVQLFANFGRSMRPPALTETLLWGQHVGSLFPYYPNPNLFAERARTWEVGSNANFSDLLARGDKLRMKAAWFNSRVNNYITQARVMSPISTAAGGTFGPYSYVNLDDPFRNRGLELQADYDAGTVFGGISYTHLIVDTGTGGYDPFPLGSLTGYPASGTLGKANGANIQYVLPPRKNLSVTAGVRLLDGKLTVGGRMSFQSPSNNRSSWTADNAETYNGKAWHLYGLWASYEINKHLTLRMAVNNLRDLNYAEMQGAAYFAGPGRTATVTLSARF
ncbi:MULTISPECIES: TonB-dependent hemoglobin/transferrin/lactoferrin family receptor [unclassified Variovorax]|uniref:TonB-dependent hemoglobin/transferrin/lactoferrin family receptor n=1 Tax=unclassified Variovorax TaxID=663243 RepID=UPI0008C1BB3D|nr:MULTISPECIES: TonB-dependent hemoglobin/transferrin/lactoferrin family receptor [unclassified Variovorax]SEJ47231.1 heme acquisition protein HasR [Variovorax sp. OK202]SFC47850.1 heme acquisition protein HasR [Variovorax sp. OK212]